LLGPPRREAAWPSPARLARSGHELEPLRVVTKVDHRGLRRDVRENWERALMKEAPSRYKDVTPVIEKVTSAGIARQGRAAVAAADRERALIDLVCSSPSLGKRGQYRLRECPKAHRSRSVCRRV
jgi:hypothetical protein